MCKTSAVFQEKMLVVSRISAVFFSYRDNSAKPNISRNFFPAVRNLQKCFRAVDFPRTPSPLSALRASTFEFRPFGPRPGFASSFFGLLAMALNYLIILPKSDGSDNSLLCEKRKMSLGAFFAQHTIFSRENAQV